MKKGFLEGSGRTVVMLLFLIASYGLLRLLGGLNSLFAVIFCGIIEAIGLFVGAQIASPTAAPFVAFLAPVAGILIGVVPHFTYAIVWGIANVIVVFVSLVMSKQSNFFGVFIAAIARFLYLLLMVRFILPGMMVTPLAEGVITVAQIDAVNLALSWPQLITTIVGGLLSMPLLFSLLLRMGVLYVDEKEKRVIDVRKEPEYAKKAERITERRESTTIVRRQDDASDEDLFGSLDDDDK